VNLIVIGTPQNLTWVGDGANNYWDSSSPNWIGATNVFVVGDNVTFNDSGSYPVDVNVAVSPGNMIVSNTAQACLFYGSGISSPGLLTKAGANELDFSGPSNYFTGPLYIQAGILSIGNGGSFGSYGSPSSITNNGVLQVDLAGSSGGGFSGPMSGSGSVQLIGGGASFALGGTNSYTGLTTIGDGCQLNISSALALGSTNAGTIVLANGRLGVNTPVGSLTVPEPIVINGTGINGAPGALYVNTPGNNITWAGPITVASGSQIRAIQNSVMNLTGAVLGTNVALECTAGNIANTYALETNSSITFQNTLSLGNSGSLTVDGIGNVILAGTTNVWGGGITVINGTLLVNGELNGGAVNVNSGGILGGSGTILGSVAVTSGALTPGNFGIGTLTINNTLTLAGSSTTAMEINRTNAQNADLLAASSIAFNGILSVVNAGPALRAGDSFKLFNGSISGAFLVTNLPTLISTNYYWDTTLLQSQGIIKVGSNVAPTPAITASIVTGTNFVFQVAASASGFNYVLQTTPSFTPTTWTGIQTNAGTGGTLNFTVPIIPGSQQSYFRIIVQ
jgi:autotransporter-associated beta strand protein